jgi:predicted phage terminase large subunit-like protein
LSILADDPTFDREEILRRYGIEELQRERTHRRLVELRDLAPTSLEAHARLMMREDSGRPIIAARHHLEWIRILEDIESNRWVCVVAPPGYAKSTWFTWAYPSWRVGATGGSLRIGIVSKTANQAVGWAKSVAQTIDHGWFKKAFPGVEKDEKRGWKQDSLFTTGTPAGPNPTIFACGVGSDAIQGKRFDEIILDDPVNWDDARSEAVMAGIRTWFKGLLMQRFPPGMGPPDGTGRCVIVLTRWGERDLVPTLEEMGFKIIRMPALGYWDRVVHADGEIEYGSEALWPEKESAQFLLNERAEDEIIFELVKQGNAAALAGDMFDGAWFQRGIPPDYEEFTKERGGVCVQYVDTAGGKDRSRGDFFAMATIGVTADKQVWVLDMVRHKEPAPGQERSVLRTFERWVDMGVTPDLLVIEDANEGRALYQRLVATTRLPLKAYTPIKDKEWRAMQFSNAYRQGLVWHPKDSWVRSYEAELRAFPAGAHDDQVDAASGAFNHTIEPGPRMRVLR